MSMVFPCSSKRRYPHPDGYRSKRSIFKNAQQLGVSLEGLSAIVFSHNHYDHTGGILTLLENCPDTPIYLRAEAKRRFYRKKDNHFNYHGEPQDTF